MTSDPIFPHRKLMGTSKSNNLSETHIQQTWFQSKTTESSEKR